MSKSRLSIAAMFVCSFATASNTMATPFADITPTLGSATVDGFTSDWNFAEDHFASLFRAGKSNKPVEGDVYLRWDAGSELLYALVMPKAGHHFFQLDDDSFIKLGNSNKLIDGSADSGFAWVSPTTLHGVEIAYGWEAAVSMTPGHYSNLNIHAQIYSDGESQTAAFAGRALPLYLPESGGTTFFPPQPEPNTPEPQASAVPEPVTGTLMLIGMAGIALASTRRKAMRD